MGGRSVWVWRGRGGYGVVGCVYGGKGGWVCMVW